MNLGKAIEPQKSAKGAARQGRNQNLVYRRKQRKQRILGLGSLLSPLPPVQIILLELCDLALLHCSAASAATKRKERQRVPGEADANPVECGGLTPLSLSNRQRPWNLPPHFDVRSHSKRKAASSRSTPQHQRLSARFCRSADILVRFGGSRPFEADKNVRAPLVAASPRWDLCAILRPSNHHLYHD
jgi:hypothetical protein